MRSMTHTLADVTVTGLVWAGHLLAATFFLGAGSVLMVTLVNNFPSGNIPDLTRILAAAMFGGGLVLYSYVFLRGFVSARRVWAARRERAASCLHCRRDKE